MYFKDRLEAGRKLAAQLGRYVDDTVVVMALSDGAILVGAEIAQNLGGALTLLLTEDIELPGDNSVVGTVDQSGGFTYNSMFSAGQLEEFASEFHNYIEAEKMNANHIINEMLGENGLLERSDLQDKVVILVSDGVRSGVSFDAAMNYLKPVRLKRLIAVSPVAAVSAVDRMHLIADELHVLNVTDNFVEANHYYDDNELPKREELLKKLDSLNSGVAENTTQSYT